MIWKSATLAIAKQRYALTGGLPALRARSSAADVARTAGASETTLRFQRRGTSILTAVDAPAGFEAQAPYSTLVKLDEARGHRAALDRAVAVIGMPVDGHPPHARRRRSARDDCLVIIRPLMRANKSLSGALQDGGRFFHQAQTFNCLVLGMIKPRSDYAEGRCKGPLY